MVVLVVDSSVHVSERLASLIKKTSGDAFVYTALSYNEAIKLFKEKKPDLVLLDTMLNEGKSIKFLKQIKASNINTTIIALSSLYDIALEAQYRSIGVDFFFDKYWEFEKIPNVMLAMKVDKKNN